MILQRIIIIVILLLVFYCFVEDSAESQIDEIISILYWIIIYLVLEALKIHF